MPAAAQAPSVKWDWISVVSVVAGLASVALAVVAIWLSLALYRLSGVALGKVDDATRSIESAVKLQRELFDRMYSDVFAMANETVRDMRRSLWPEDRVQAADEDEDQLFEGRIAKLRSELSNEISAVSGEVGLTREKLEGLRARLGPVVDRAIAETRMASTELEKEAAAGGFTTPVLRIVAQALASIHRFSSDIGSLIEARSSMSSDGCISR